MNAARSHSGTPPPARCPPRFPSVRALLLSLALVAAPHGAAAAASELPSLGDASSSLISPALEREIGQQFMGYARHARFGITHGRSGIAVD